MLDVAQEGAPDDATTAPHERNAAIVELPIEPLGGLLEQHKTLGIRDDLGGVEGFSDRLDELLLVARVLGVRRPVEYLRSTRALVEQRREAPGEHRLADERHRNAVVERLDRRPLASAFLARIVLDLRQQVSLVLFVVEDACRDLD